MTVSPVVFQRTATPPDTLARAAVEPLFLPAVPRVAVACPRSPLGA